MELSGVHEGTENFHRPFLDIFMDTVVGQVLGMHISRAGGSVL